LAISDCELDGDDLWGGRKGGQHGGELQQGASTWRHDAVLSKGKPGTAAYHGEDDDGARWLQVAARHFMADFD
jgi:hypothetical protein